MTACWEQVGAVLAANALLSRASCRSRHRPGCHLRSIARLAPGAHAHVRARRCSGRAAARRGDRARRDHADLAARHHRRPGAAPAAGADGALRPQGGRRTGQPRPPPSPDQLRRQAGRRARWPSTPPTSCRRACDRRPSRRHRPAATRQRLTLKADLRAVGLITSRHADLLRATARSSWPPAGRSIPCSQLRAAATTQPAPTAGFVLGKSMGRLGVDSSTAPSPATSSASPPTEPNEVVVRVTAGRRSWDPTSRAVPVPCVPGGDRSTPPPAAPMTPRSSTADQPTDGVKVRGPTSPPPLVRDALVLNRFEAAIARSPRSRTGGAPPTRARPLRPRRRRPVAHRAATRPMPTSPGSARWSASVDRRSATSAPGGPATGVTIAPKFDRIMAYPELAIPAYRLLARYDRTRLLPGVDAIPPDSVTLLETNPRFVAAFLAGVNHELNRELLWRRYPTDQRGTPVRRFWDRLGGRATPTSPRCTSGRPTERSSTSAGGRVQPRAADPRRAAPPLPEHGGARHPGAAAHARRAPTRRW